MNKIQRTHWVDRIVASVATGVVFAVLTYLDRECPSKTYQIMASIIGG